jgi:hypothetical protein
MVATRKHTRKESGAVLLLFAFALPVLLGFVGLAIDIARLASVRSELQNAATVSALSGAQGLIIDISKGYNLEESRQRSRLLLKYNPADGRYPSEGDFPLSAPSEDDIEIGKWPKSGVFLDSGAFEPELPSELDALSWSPAVRVRAAFKPGSNNGSLDLFLMPIWKIFKVSVEADSVAIADDVPPEVAGPGALFPIAMSECFWRHYWAAGAPSPNTTEAVRIIGGSISASCNISGDWADFGLGGGMNRVSSLINGSSISPFRKVGDPTNIVSGTATVALSAIECRLYRCGTNGKPLSGSIRTPFKAVMPIVSGNNPSSGSITGFGVMEIFDVDATGNGTVFAKFLPGLPPSGIPGYQNLFYGAGGGGDFGAYVLHPVTVF